MTRALTVLCEGSEGLIDKPNIRLINVEPEKPELACSTPTNTVQEL